jgi:hypothetical protein
MAATVHDWLKDLAPVVISAPLAESQAQVEQSHVTFLIDFFDELRRKVPIQ